MTLVNCRLQIYGNKKIVLPIEKHQSCNTSGQNWIDELDIRTHIDG